MEAIEANKDSRALLQCAEMLVFYNRTQPLEQINFIKLIDRKLSVENSIDALELALTLQLILKKDLDLTHLITSILEKQVSVIPQTTQIQTGEASSLAASCKTLVLLAKYEYPLLTLGYH